jgi:hypothetical protein
MIQGEDLQTEKKPEVSQTTENKPEKKEGGIGRKIGWIVFVVFVIALVVVVFVKTG